MIAKSIASILQGMGPAGARGVKNPTVTTVPATNNITLTLNQPAHCGWVQIQVKGNTAGGGLVSLSLRGTDTNGNFWDIGYVNPVAPGSAGDFVSLMVPFITDVPLVSIAAILVLGAAATGGSPQLDAEVWASLM